MSNKISAGIIGCAGYTGGEMLRILLNHPNVDIAFVHSRSNAGEPVSKIHRDLAGETELRFASEMSKVDVLFLCVGHGEAKEFIAQHTVDEGTRIIDLSEDFRLQGNAVVGARTFVYGLPEANKEEIQSAQNIANPGCFATALQLALLPLAKQGTLQQVHATGITGSTGAGQKLQSSSHFSWRANNIQAYKSLSHQHMNEVMETLRTAQPGCEKVNFIPWRGDFARGIYITAYTETNLSLEEANALYREYYTGHAFTYLSDQMIDLKQVVNTNKCLLYLEKEEGKLIIHAAIDNLLKGASGQAVQNMNLMFGLPETMGLKLKSIAF